MLLPAAPVRASDLITARHGPVPAGTDRPVRPGLRVTPGAGNPAVPWADDWGDS
ncbi:hypothetical protein SCWH03_37190 [Streptomyces pacificus]|uniref:Uncharacterized protein n=1 Tax=Streptomyces pacificus TaxID=2705029 RepID=A0A6A0AYS4_9ACTN|nr:hypothetical protein SCWH03_37190 [Streptomyces pacificus]